MAVDRKGRALVLRINLYKRRREYKHAARGGAACGVSGGDVCESNAPETFCTPRNGFEGRGIHQESFHLLITSANDQKVVRFCGSPMILHFRRVHGDYTIRHRSVARAHVAWLRPLGAQYAFVSYAAGDSLGIEVFQQGDGILAADP